MLKLMDKALKKVPLFLMTLEKETQSVGQKKFCFFFLLNSTEWSFFIGNFLEQAATIETND